MSVSVGACAVMPGGKELGLVDCYWVARLSCGKDNKKSEKKSCPQSLFGVADGATCCV